MAPTIRQGVMYAPFTTGRHAPIAGEDQGRVIVGILQNPALHRGKVYPLYGPVEQWAQVVANASTGRPARNDAASLYAEADRISGRPGSEFLVQHLREVAIDHTNGVFAGTNDVVETIGGRAPLTVEAFVARHRDAFG